jgi:hypothetical protein
MKIQGAALLTCVFILSPVAPGLQQQPNIEKSANSGERPAVIL